MITIPESIKSLLKSDSAHKNFRVHFPNGERADITNENIISESVTLTESICSQQTLMFNTCETPMIEFETFGVENIKGAIIECSLEVECPSTVTGAVYKSDIDKYVYPIPYGKFIINSCKKQSDMTHRQVIAYHQSKYTNGIVNALEAAKRNWFLTSSQNTNGVNYRIMPCQLFTVNKNILPDSASPQYVTNTKTITHYLTEQFSSYRYRILVNCVCDIHEAGTAYSTINEIPNIQDVQDAFPDIRTACKNKILEWASLHHITAPTEEQLSFLNKIDTCYAYGSETDVSSGRGVFVAFWDDLYSQYFENYVDLISLFFSDLNLGSSGINKGHILIPYSVTVQMVNVTTSPITVVEEQTYTIFSDRSTLLRRLQTVETENNAMDFIDNIPTVASAYYELRGKICKMNRDNTITPLSIENKLANPVATLTPSDYSEFWYDDDMTKPYGKITCNYKKPSGEDAYAEVYLVDDYSEKAYKSYDISNNAIVKSTVFFGNTMQELLETMATNMDDISYMPLNLTALGRPDLEAGDVVTITTRDNETIPCLIMQRRLTGIQGLTDNITATETDEDISSIQLNTTFNSTTETLSISLVGGR